MMHELLAFSGPVREGTFVAIVGFLVAMFLVAYVRHAREKRPDA